MENTPNLSIAAALSLAAAFLPQFAPADGFAVSDVSFRQTANRDVVINYRLGGDESAIVTIDVLTNGVSIGAAAPAKQLGAVRHARERVGVLP